MRFRKIVLIVAMISCSVVSGTSRAQEVRFGLKTGVTVSKFHSPPIRTPEVDVTFDTERRIGFVAVGFAEWISSNRLSIVSEVGYTERGYSTVHEGRDEQNIPTGTFRINDRIQYISTMVLGKVSVVRGFHAPYVILGPRLDILVGVSNDEPGSLGAALSSTSWGGTLGVGVPAIRHGSVVVGIEVRVNVDATNVLPEVPRDGYHRAIDVAVSFRI